MDLDSHCPLLSHKNVERKQKLMHETTFEHSIHLKQWNPIVQYTRMYAETMASGFLAISFIRSFVRSGTFMRRAIQIIFFILLFLIILLSAFQFFSLRFSSFKTNQQIRSEKRLQNFCRSRLCCQDQINLYFKHRLSYTSQ